MSIVSPLPLFPDEAALRHCRKCGEDKPLTAFALRSDQPGQRRHTCRACKSKKPAGYVPQKRRSADQPWPCALCGIPKLLHEFRKRKDRPFGADYICLSCDRTRHKAWKERSGYKRKPLTAEQRQREHDGHRRRTYGLLPGDVDALLAAQGHACALCRRNFRGPKSINVDHDHKTGRVRGLLCPQCNAALGRLGDGEAGLLRALAYVRGNPPDSNP